MKKLFCYLVCCIGLAACNKNSTPQKTSYVAEKPIPAILDSLKGFTFDQLATVQFYNDPSALEIYRYVKKDTSYVKNATAIYVDSLLRVGYQLDPFEKGALIGVENDSSGYVTKNTVLVVSFAEGRQLRYKVIDGKFTLASIAPSTTRGWATPPAAIILYDEKTYGINRTPVVLYVDLIALTGKRKISRDEPGIDLKRVSQQKVQEELEKKAAEKKAAKKKKKKKTEPEESPPKKTEDDF